MICTRYIPKEKFSQFHEILCATGGRYVREPFPIFSTVEVQYEPGDYVALEEAWSRCNTMISEKNSNQWWRVMFRRFGIPV